MRVGAGVRLGLGSGFGSGCRVGIGARVRVGLGVRREEGLGPEQPTSARFRVEGLHRVLVLEPARVPPHKEERVAPRVTRQGQTAPGPPHRAHRLPRRHHMPPAPPVLPRL